MALAFTVIGVSARYPDIPLSIQKKRLCLYAKKLLLEIYDRPERTEFTTDLNYYKEKLTKNLADLNTFETSMPLRD